MTVLHFRWKMQLQITRFPLRSMDSCTSNWKGRKRGGNCTLFFEHLACTIIPKERERYRLLYGCLFVWKYVYVYNCICLCVCMYVCIYIYVCICLYIYVCLCVYACMYMLVWKYVCMRVYLYESMLVWNYAILLNRCMNIRCPVKRAPDNRAPT